MARGNGPVWLVLLGAVLVAVLVNLGTLHSRPHDGDTLMSTLVSLYAWTPFFWEQDRFGMLTALLATPIRNPFYNLIAQNVLTTFLSLLGFFGLARLVAGRERWVVAGSAAAVLFFVGVCPEGRFQFLTTFGPFGQGLGTMAAGAAVLASGEKPAWVRNLIGISAVFMGAWVHTGVAFVLLPLLLVRALLTPSTVAPPAVAPAVAQPPWRWRRLAAALRRFSSHEAAFAAGVVAVAFLASVQLSALAHVRMAYRILPVAEWSSCWAGLWRNARAEGNLSDLHLVALGAALAAGAAALALRRGVGLREAVLAFLPSAAGAATLFLAMGTLNWTKAQGLLGRYTLPSVAALDVAVASFAAVVFQVGLGERGTRRAGAVGLAAFVVICVARYFPLSPTRIRADLDRAVGARSAEVIDAGVTHVAGRYWTVWPTVFHANLLLHERGSDRVIWGIAHRASPTADQWASIPRERWLVAAIPSEFEDEFTADRLRSLGLPPLAPVGRTASFTLCVPVAERPPGPAQPAR